MSEASELVLPMIVDCVCPTRPLRSIDADTWACSGVEGLRTLRRGDCDERLKDATALGHDPAKATYWAERWATVLTWSCVLSALCLPQVGDIVDVSLADGSFATVRVRARRVHGRAVQSDAIWAILVEPVDTDHCDKIAANPPPSWDGGAEPGPGDLDTRH